MHAVPKSAVLYSTSQQQSAPCKGRSCFQVKERLLKILTFWSERKLYDKDTMHQMEAALLSGDPNAMLQAPAPKQVGDCMSTWKYGRPIGRPALSVLQIVVANSIFNTMCNLSKAV